MLSFRERGASVVWDSDDIPVEALIDEVFAAANFYVHGLTLEWVPGAEEDALWELFRGRLLDPSQTRQRRRFRSWSVFQVQHGRRSAEPLLSIKLDAAAGELHVVRALPCYVWEAYDSGDNVILSRETIKWVRELIGTSSLADFARPGELADELAGRLWQAVVGTSRLPLTSVEAPLPAFTFGQLTYVYRPHRRGASSASAMQSWRDVVDLCVDAVLCPREVVKLLEFLLRAVPSSELREATRLFVERWRSLGRSTSALPALWRAMFNDVALSPYTDFVDKSLAVLRVLVEEGLLAANEQVDALGGLLRQLGRHLTAYDLITFHHRGANYPDALLLDAALKEYLRLATQHRGLFDGTAPVARLRRRALRQACFLRHFYEGHAVPDEPTSPGENARVLPPPHARVPEEQILQPARRRRRLYLDDPLTQHLGDDRRHLLQRSLADLAHPDELRELGMALFIDRPLGTSKLPGEPDQTPLLAYEAFSRNLALTRASDLTRFARAMGLDFDAQAVAAAIRALNAAGLPVSAAFAPERAVVSLADARRVGDDFVLLRTLPSGLSDFVRVFPIGDLARQFGVEVLQGQARILLIRVPSASSDGAIAIFNGQGQKRLEFEIDGSRGFRTRGGVEFPAAGLRLIHVWPESSAEASARAVRIAIAARDSQTP